MRYAFSGLTAVTCLGLLGACATDGGPAQREAAPRSTLRYATAGLTLVHEEVDRTRDHARSQDVAIRYRLWAKGFPQDRPYSLWVERFVGGTAENQPMRERLRVAIDDAVTTASGGELQFVLARQGDETTDPGPDLLTRVPEGHSVVLTLVSDDRRVESWTRIVPFPIEAFGKTGCRLSVESEFADRLVVTVLGERFQPNEEVEVLSVTGGETTRSVQRATDKGTIRAVLYPQAQGRRRGATALTVNGSKCTVATHFHWGE